MKKTIKKVELIKEMSLHSLLKCYLDKISILKKKTQLHTRPSNVAFFNLFLKNRQLELYMAQLLRIVPTFTGKDIFNHKLLTTTHLTVEPEDKVLAEAIKLEPYTNRTHNLNVIVKCIEIMLHSLDDLVVTELKKEKQELFTGSLTDFKECITVCLNEIPVFLKEYEECFTTYITNKTLI